MTKVKICGLKEIEHVETAVKAGADFIGFMFAPSKRRITVEEAVELAKAIPGTVKKSGFLSMKIRPLFVKLQKKSDSIISSITGMKHPNRFRKSGCRQLKRSRFEVKRM